MSGQTSVIIPANRHDVELADVLMEIKNVNGELKTVINTVGGFHILAALEANASVVAWKN